MPSLIYLLLRQFCDLFDEFGGAVAGHKGDSFVGG
jgi:hypothetical protein